MEPVGRVGSRHAFQSPPAIRVAHAAPGVALPRRREMMMRDLHDEELRALLAFRQRHGRCWKAALLLRWSAGTDADEPGSALLRHLRNIGGPRWLIGLPAATLDDAARRFAGNVDPV
ncbi:MAG: hypothetical protein PSY12_05185, partial [bacterium]|nr:hypothetical protein [bacterium]